MIIAHQANAQKMYDLHESKFTESQKLRIESISALNECGKSLMIIRDLLKDATKTNPIETDVGTFNSFSDYLNSGNLSFGARYAYSYIKLAENWDIVLHLGMQDTSDEKTLQKSMRLSRTLKIIDWYKAKIAAGWEPEYLTLDLYWAEDNAPRGYDSRPNYKNLYEEAQATIARLEAELNRYRLEALV
jgi:hypothetical protein